MYIPQLRMTDPQEHRVPDHPGSAGPGRFQPRRRGASLGADGKLQPLQQTSALFTHPHGLVLDDEGSIYVAQWNSGQTYPIKLERV